MEPQKPDLSTVHEQSEEESSSTEVSSGLESESAGIDDGASDPIKGNKVESSGQDHPLGVVSVVGPLLDHEEGGLISAVEEGEKTEQAREHGVERDSQEEDGKNLKAVLSKASLRIKTPELQLPPEDTFESPSLSPAPLTPSEQLFQQWREEQIASKPKRIRSSSRSQSVLGSLSSRTPPPQVHRPFSLPSTRDMQDSDADDGDVKAIRKKGKKKRRASAALPRVVSQTEANLKKLSALDYFTRDLFEDEGKERRAYFDFKNTIQKINAAAHKRVMLKADAPVHAIAAELKHFHREEHIKIAESNTKEMTMWRNHLGKVKNTFNELTNAKRQKQAEIRRLQHILKEFRGAEDHAEQGEKLKERAVALQERIDAVNRETQEEKEYRTTLKIMYSRLKDHLDNNAPTLRKMMLKVAKDNQDLVLLNEMESSIQTSLKFADHDRQLWETKFSEVKDLQTIALKNRKKHLIDRVQEETTGPTARTSSVKQEYATEVTTKLNKRVAEQGAKAFVLALTERIPLASERSGNSAYEDAFQKIQRATGVKDGRELITKWSQQEELSKKLTTMRSESSSRISELNGDKSHLEGVMQDILTQKEKKANYYAMENKYREAAEIKRKNRTKYSRVSALVDSVFQYTKEMEERTRLALPTRRRGPLGVHLVTEVDHNSFLSQVAVIPESLHHHAASRQSILVHTPSVSMTSPPILPPPTPETELTTTMEEANLQSALTFLRACQKTLSAMLQEISLRVSQNPQNALTLQQKVHTSTFNMYQNVATPENLRVCPGGAFPGGRPNTREREKRRPITLSVLEDEDKETILSQSQQIFEAEDIKDNGVTLSGILRMPSKSRLPNPQADELRGVLTFRTGTTIQSSDTDSEVSEVQNRESVKLHSEQVVALHKIYGKQDKRDSRSSSPIPPKPVQVASPTKPRRRQTSHSVVKPKKEREPKQSLSWDCSTKLPQTSPYASRVRKRP